MSKLHVRRERYVSIKIFFDTCLNRLLVGIVVRVKLESAKLNEVVRTENDLNGKVPHEKPNLGNDFTTPTNE